MTDSSSDESTEEWLMYSSRPDWKDVKPIAQDNGPYPVVSIAYPEKYRDVYDYFRGVVAIGEKSERVLCLCRDALILNPANYNVWQYRRLVLKHLNSDLTDELNYTTTVITDNPKNYQVWHHRRVIVEWLQDGSHELDFTRDVLIVDTKNYHAWQHRQWALSTFKLFDGELAYIDDLLKFDIRNNSVWTHRYFVLNNLEEGFSTRVINAEVDYVINALQKPPLNNECAWNYLRGILLHSDAGLTEPKVRQFSEDLYEKGCRSAHLLAFLADSSIEMVEKNLGDVPSLFKLALQLFADLATQHDIIRASYWNFIKQESQQRYSRFVES